MGGSSVGLGGSASLGSDDNGARLFCRRDQTAQRRERYLCEDSGQNVEDREDHTVLASVNACS